MSEFRTVDPAALEMLGLGLGISTQFDRYQAQQPQCKFGLEGVCCKICLQGPCRIIPNKKGADMGICGARDYTIVARNVARTIAGGACAHSDHGREIAHVLLAVSEGKAKDYRIMDSGKLHAVAKKVGVKVEGRKDVEIAKDVAILALEDFGKHTDDPCTWLYTNIDEDRRKKFKKTRINTPAIDRSVVQLLHQTCVGTDAEPVSIIFGGLQAALADFTGMSLSTDLSDILFGTPTPIMTTANMGSLKVDKVNIAVNGHNPLMSEMIVQAARDLKDEAVAKGATGGVNVVGICCTGNEVLMRQGVPIVTTFGSQELAIMTGALDALVMDVQCIIPGVQEVAACYHTHIISTTHFSKMPSASHVEFHQETAYESACTIVRMAIDRYTKRQADKIHIPNVEKKVIGGFSLEALFEIFGKIHPESPVRVITEAIANGEIKGVAQFAGCNNHKAIQNHQHLTIAKFLAANDIFLVSTGCAAQAFAMDGLLNAEGVEKYAGPGLKKVLKRIADANAFEVKEIPLIFHMGSCVDNTRITNLFTAMAKEMGVTIPQLPIVASAPEAMSEKAVAIGSWNVAMGLPVHVGVMAPLTGSDLIFDLVTEAARDVFGGYFIFEPDPVKAGQEILERIEKRAWRLKVHKKVAADLESFPNPGYEAQ